jgi:hypothetical protein
VHKVQTALEKVLQADSAYFPELQVVHAWQTVSAAGVQLEATNNPVPLHAEQSWGAVVPPAQKKPLGHATVIFVLG